MVPFLLTAHDASGHVHLILGTNSIAGNRCAKSFEAGARPVVVAPPDAQVDYALERKVVEGSASWVKRAFEDGDLQALGRDEVDNIVDAVFITLGENHPLSHHVSSLCRRLRIPVNVADSSKLSTFSFPSTHSDGPLQIGITTSGNGCKLASRLRREISLLLPSNFGPAIERLGSMRRRILEEDYRHFGPAELTGENSEDDATGQRSNFNQLITESDHNAAKTRRIRWLSQICEYWPLQRLATATARDIDMVLEVYKKESRGTDSIQELPSEHHSGPERRSVRPQIILAGSGPGSPHLLTLATRRAIEIASIILADKLVPAPVLDLIPRRTPVRIARKFPGNADTAQQELMELGLDALRNGMVVLRLKQGDPFVYGRGGEEYDFFRGNGFTPIVLPGITSSLSAPLFAAIPATHRSVADQILICTGTGRKGAAPSPPPYVKSQTVVFLMALHRLLSLVESLIGTEQGGVETNRSPWPKETPCAVIERASCHDQRVIRSTLQHIVAAVEEEGSRPPGLLVLGHSCEVLKDKGGSRWVVEEGCKDFDELMQGSESALHVLTSSEKESAPEHQELVTG